MRIRSAKAMVVVRFLIYLYNADVKANDEEIAMVQSESIIDNRIAEMGCLSAIDFIRRHEAENLAYCLI